MEVHVGIGIGIGISIGVQGLLLEAGSLVLLDSIHPYFLIWRTDVGFRYLTSAIIIGVISSAGLDVQFGHIFWFRRLDMFLAFPLVKFL